MKENNVFRDQFGRRMCKCKDIGDAMAKVMQEPDSSHCSFLKDMCAPAGDRLPLERRLILGKSLYIS